MKAFRKSKTGRKAGAILLAACLATGMSAVTAFAANDVSEPVVAEEGQTISVGNVTVKDNGYAAGAYTDSADASLKVSGNVSLNDNRPAEYGYDEVAAVFAENDGSGSASVDVSGNAEVKSAQNPVAVGAYTEGGTAKVNVDGNAAAEALSDGWSSGVSIENYKGTADVHIGKDLTAKGGKDSGEAAGAVIYSHDNTIVAVDGGITAEAGYAAGIYGRVGGGKTDVTVKDGITSKGSQYGEGIHAEVFDSAAGEFNVNVTGDVIAEGDYSTGVDAGLESGSITIDINGNVEAGGAGIYSHPAWEESMVRAGGTNTVLVHGNVTGGEYGVVINNEAEEYLFVKDTSDPEEPEIRWPDHDILVENVLSGGECGILVYENDAEGTENGGKVDITVWKIELNKRGNVAETMLLRPEEEEEDGPDPVADNVEKAIKYIIKLEQPKEGARLSATKADGSALEQSHDFDVANEGDEVFLKVDLDKGYKLTAAYNGDGEKVALLKDTNGNYYVQVPKGGDVYLSVELEKEFYDLTFDLNGGSLDGKTGTFTLNYEYGSVVKLPAAPTKDGYKFLYWKGSQYDAEAEYTVEEAHAFTAEYEEIVNEEEKKEDPKETKKDTNNKTTLTSLKTAEATLIAPQTDDSSSPALWIMVLSAAAVLLAVAVTWRRRAR